MTRFVWNAIIGASLLLTFSLYSPVGLMGGPRGEGNVFGYLLLLLGPGFLVAGIIGWAEQNRFDRAIADYRSPPDRIPIGRWCVFGFGAVLLVGGIVFWDIGQGRILDLPMRAKVALFQVMGLGLLLMGAPPYCFRREARRHAEAERLDKEEQARRRAEQEEQARRDRALSEARRAEETKQEEAKRKAAAERQAALEEKRWRQSEEVRQQAYLAEQNAILAAQEEERRRKEDERQQVAATLEQAHRYGAKVNVKKRVGDADVEIILDAADVLRERERVLAEQEDEQQRREREAARRNRVPFPPD